MSIPSVVLRSLTICCRNKWINYGFFWKLIFGTFRFFLYFLHLSIGFCRVFDPNLVPIFLTAIFLNFLAKIQTLKRNQHKLMENGKFPVVLKLKNSSKPEKKNFFFGIPKVNRKNSIIFKQFLFLFFIFKYYLNKFLKYSIFHHIFFKYNFFIFKICFFIYFYGWGNFLNFLFIIKSGLGDGGFSKCLSFQIFKN